MTTDREVYEGRRMELADFLVAHPADFDMLAWGYRTTRWGNVCGTVACIAGHAAILGAEQGVCHVTWMAMDHSRDLELDLKIETADGDRMDVDDWAKQYLGMTSTNLFYNYDLNAEEAAKALLDEPYITEEQA